MSVRETNSGLPDVIMLEHRVVLVMVWLVLIVATVLSVVLAEGGQTGRLTTVALIGIAAVKAALVVRYFMEVGRGSGNWAYFFAVWVSAVACILLVFYLKT